MGEITPKNEDNEGCQFPWHIVNHPSKVTNQEPHLWRIPRAAFVASLRRGLPPSRRPKLSGRLSEMALVAVGLTHELRTFGRTIKLYGYPSGIPIYIYVCVCIADWRANRPGPTQAAASQNKHIHVHLMCFFCSKLVLTRLTNFHAMDSRVTVSPCFFHPTCDHPWVPKTCGLGLQPSIKRGLEK